MKKTNVYIVIRDEETKEEINIKGSLELLGAFMKGMANIDFSPIALPIDQPQHEREELQHVQA